MGAVEVNKPSDESSTTAQNGSQQNAKEGEYTVDEALALLGFGRVQLAMTVTAALCMLVTINETMGFVNSFFSVFK